jgi:hypothetical protein
LWIRIAFMVCDVALADFFSEAAPVCLIIVSLIFFFRWMIC